MADNPEPLERAADIEELNMLVEKETPSGELGVIEQPSHESIPPTLPEPSTKEAIKIALRQLAESEQDGTDEEVDLQHISDRYGIGIKPLRSTYESIKNGYLKEKELKAAPIPTPQECADKEQTEKARQVEQRKVQRIVRFLQRCPNLLPVFHKLLERSGYLCGLPMAASLLLSHGARLLPDSTAFTFNGSSASGKSAGIIKGSAFLPEEMVLNITSMSNMALQYVGDIKHKYVMFGEMAPPIDGQDDPRQMALRQLLSENKITHYTVDRIGKANELVKKVTEGPCVAVATTTKDPKNFSDELLNRGAWITADDSPELTRAVLSSMAARAADPLKQDDQFLTLMIKAFQELHRTLRPLPVVIPFADQIKPVNDHVTARRLFPMVLNFTCVSALLHQHIRERQVVNGRVIIVAQKADYRLAYQVLAPSAPRVLESCPERARKAFTEALMPAFADGKALSTNQIQRLIKAPKGTVTRWLQDYVEAGLLECLDWKTGKQKMYTLGAPEHFTQDLGIVSPDSVREWADFL